MNSKLENFVDKFGNYEVIVELDVLYTSKGMLCHILSDALSFMSYYIEHDISLGVDQYEMKNWVNVMSNYLKKESKGIKKINYIIVNDIDLELFRQDGSLLPPQTEQAVEQDKTSSHKVDTETS